MEEHWDLADVNALLASEDALPADTIRSWMADRDPEVHARAFYVLTEQPQRVQGHLPNEEQVQFGLRYLERDFRDNVSSDYRLTSFDVADFCRGWFLSLWRNRPHGDHELEQLRDLFARLCREDNAHYKEAITLGALEHLFVYEDIERFFSEWAEDPLLKDIYKDACWLGQEWRKMPDEEG